jgi:nitronate monooxygenase
MAQGLVQDIPAVAELVERIVAEAEAIITGRLRATVTGDPVPTGA